MQPEVPQFDPEKHVKVFRGLTLAIPLGDESNGSDNNVTDYHDGCRICGTEGPSDHSTGMHWSTTESTAKNFATARQIAGFSKERKKTSGKLYEGFVNKDNVMSREEIDEENIPKYEGITQKIYGDPKTSIAKLHQIKHLADDPKPRNSAGAIILNAVENEVPVRPGSTVNVTKTTDFVPSEKNPRKHHKIIVKHPRPIPMTIKHV